MTFASPPFPSARPSHEMSSAGKGHISTNSDFQQQRAAPTVFSPFRQGVAHSRRIDGLLGQLQIEPGEEFREIVGDEVRDADGVGDCSVAGLAVIEASGLGRHQGRGHAFGLRHGEVSRQVLEHRRRSGIDPTSLEKSVIGGLGRFWRQLRRDYVERILEQPIETELPCGEDRMVSRAVGEDQLSPGQPFDFAGQDRIGLEAGAINVVDEFEKALGLIQALLDEPAQGRAMARIIMLVQRLRRRAVETEKLDQEQGDALVDTRPDAAIGR